MFNPPWASLPASKKPNRPSFDPFHKSTVLQNPHIPPPASPSRSPDPPKAPSPSPLSVSEFLDLEVGGSGGVGDESRREGGGGGVGDSFRECEGESVGVGKDVGGEGIVNYERVHAVRAALESLSGIDEGREVVRGGGGDVKEVAVEGGPKWMKMDEGKERREDGRAKVWTPTQKSISAASNRGSELPHRSQHRHHCILNGHLFVKRREEDNGQREGNQKTTNRVAEKRIKCWRCGEKLAEEESWVCEVGICGIEACKNCVRRWERERRTRITEGWLGTTRWEGYGL